MTAQGLVAYDVTATAIEAVRGTGNIVRGEGTAWDYLAVGAAALQFDEIARATRGVNLTRGSSIAAEGDELSSVSPRQAGQMDLAQPRSAILDDVDEVVELGSLGNTLATSEDSLKFINATSKETSAIGISQLKTGRLIAHMKRSEIGRFVLDAAQSDIIDLTVSIRNDVPKGLMGSSRGTYGTAYAFNTQSYDETVLTLIHEGIHALGVGGSRRAEALARLAELSHQGHTIDYSAIRQVVRDIRAAGTYDNLPWRLNAQSIYFPDITF